MPQQLLRRRNTCQDLLPQTPSSLVAGDYNLFPAAPVPANSIGRGFEAIAERLASSQAIRIDGFVGVFWEEFRDNLNSALVARGISPQWVDMSQHLKSEAEIDRIARYCLGGIDPLFGRRYEGELLDLGAEDVALALKQAAHHPPDLVHAHERGPVVDVRRALGARAATTASSATACRAGSAPRPARGTRP